MSVAFRRDSDEEHREPRFERPIPSGPNLVTPRGLRLMRERVVALETGMPEAAVSDREALARDLRYWRTRLITAIVPPPPGSDQVAFGSTVRVKVNGDERILAIVGDDEAEPASGRIAFSSPLARALMAASEGDEVRFGASVAELIAIVAARVEEG